MDWNLLVEKVNNMNNILDDYLNKEVDLKQLVKKIEVLKVWYSIFCVIMDDKDMYIGEQLEKLNKLRKRLKDESPELEKLVAQMKN